MLTLSATGGDGVVVADEPGNATSRGGIGFSHFFGLNDLFQAHGNAIVTTGLNSADTASFAPGGTIGLLLKGPHGERVGETSIAVTGTTIGDMVTALNTAFTGKATFALDATALGGGPAKVVVRNDTGQQTDPLRLGGVETPSRQQQISGDGYTHVCRQRRRVGRVRYASQELGHPERRLVTGDGDVRHHRDQQSPGLADAVDRGDDWRVAVANGEERKDFVADVVGRCLARFRPSAEITARCKDVPHSGDDQAPEIGIGVDETHGTLDPVVHGGRQRVSRRRTVDHAPRDDTFPLQSQVRRTQLVVHRSVLSSCAPAPLVPGARSDDDPSLSRLVGAQRR